MKKVILLVIIVLFHACSKPKEKDNYKNILNLAIRDEIPTFDPSSAYDVVSSTVMYQTYEQLYEYHYLKRPFALKPLLAKGMPKIENDGKRYIINIQKNVLYHNDPSLKKGRSLIAQDFINQIKRLAFKPNKSNGWWLFDGKIKGLNDFREKAGSDFQKYIDLKVSGLKTRGDHTLIIDLLEPYPQMIYALSMSFTSPLPIESITYYKNNLSKNIVGTGPFKLESFKPDHPITLTKFKKYKLSSYPKKGDRKSHSKNLLIDAGKPLPFLNEINLHIIKKHTSRWDSFINKKIDIISLSKEHLKIALNKFGELKDDLKEKNISLQIAPTLTFWWLSFNMKDPLLGKNKDLRKAITYAIDRDKFIDLSTNKTGQKANSIYPPGVPGYNPSKTISINYNIDLSKKLLKKAGYPGGKGLPVLQYDTRGDTELTKKQAEYIKSQMKKIGINLKIVVNSFTTFLKKVREGSLQLWMGGWSMDYPDAENLLQLLYSKNSPPGPNATFYHNEIFDSSFKKFKTVYNIEEKKDLMKSMEEEVLKDLPWFMLYYQRTYTLFHKKIQNYRYSDIIPNVYKYLRIKKSNR